MAAFDDLDSLSFSHAHPFTPNSVTTPNSDPHLILLLNLLPDLPLPYNQYHLFASVFMMDLTPTYWSSSPGESLFLEFLVTPLDLNCPLVSDTDNSANTIR